MEIARLALGGFGFRFVLARVGRNELVQLELGVRVSPEFLAVVQGSGLLKG
jgi:hypothetical protein